LAFGQDAQFTGKENRRGFEAQIKRRALHQIRIRGVGVLRYGRGFARAAGCASHEANWQTHRGAIFDKPEPVRRNQKPVSLHLQEIH